MTTTRIPDVRTATAPSPLSRSSVLNAFWNDWQVGVVGALMLVGAAAMVMAWLMPRGPVSSTDALVAIAVSLIVGGAAGVVIGSRWSVLLAPIGFAIVFELARIGAAGPTVDMIDLTSFFGVGAFAVGRLVHGILALFPMMIGARYGVAAARALGHPTARGFDAVGWVVIGLLTFLLATIAIAVGRPASTAPILGTGGGSVPGSVAELATVNLGGQDQVVMLRGRSVDSPVLLYLAGGPGGTDLGAMRGDVGLESSFVVATWDQRGTGKSYGAITPFASLTLEQMVADTVELTDYLRDRFDEDKIYLVGNSWGTLLGVLTLQQRPDLYAAFVGTGQMVDIAATDVMFWEDTIAWAEQTGDTGLAASLRDLGPPPYDDPAAYLPIVSAEHSWNAYPGVDDLNEMPGNLFVPENSVMDIVGGMRGLIDAYAALYPQIQGIDLRQDVTSLEVPVTIVLGKYEARGRAVPAREWFDTLDAPSKDLVIFEDSGHRPSFEQPADFTRLMEEVAAATRS